MVNRDYKCLTNAHNELTKSKNYKVLVSHYGLEILDWQVWTSMRVDALVP